MRCPSCDGADTVELFHQPNIPTLSVAFFDDRADAVAVPRGSLRLCGCSRCGLVFNADFDPELAQYTAHHEESQGYSPHFAEFATALATGWTDRYGLRGRRILEVGCGKAEFLAMFCELADATGVGIDPAGRLDRLAEPARARLELIVDSFDARFADLDADALLCRHTLEHISDVGAFLDDVGRWSARHPGAVVLFELPDVQRVFDEVAFWDVYYEHCSYFTSTSLVDAFRRAGLAVHDCRLVYDGQYLVIEAGAGERHEPAAGAGDAVIASGRRFASDFVEQSGRCRANLEAFAADGSRVAIWGASSKGSALLNTIGEPELVAYAIDINPNMRGKHMVGTGHQVRAPEDMLDDAVDVVVTMNPVYRNEIAATIERLGLSTRQVTINELLTTEVTV